MDTLVFVEVLDRRGNVRERTRVDSFPTSIGRAYSNRVILEDCHVCPEHVRIAPGEDGVLFLEDLNSVNALHLVKPAERVKRIIITPDLLARIGHTVLRFRFEGHAVPPAPAERAGGDTRFTRIGRSVLPGFVIAAGMACLMMLGFLSTSKHIEPVDILDRSAVMLLAFGAWAGVWAFANRLLAHRFRYLAHMSFAVAAGAAFMLLRAGHGYLEFIVSPGMGTMLVEFAIFSGSLFLLLYGHLTILSVLSNLRRVLPSAVAAVVVCALLAMSVYSDKRAFSTDIKVQFSLKPLDSKWLFPGDTAKVFESLHSLKSEIDRAAQKKAADN